MFVSTNKRNLKSPLGGITVRKGIFHGFSQAGNGRGRVPGMLILKPLQVTRRVCLAKSRALKNNL
jgi:hypothetical protein